MKTTAAMADAFRRVMKENGKTELALDAAIAASPLPAVEAEIRSHAGNADIFQRWLSMLNDEAAPEHSDDQAVDRFAAMMKAKLATARGKGRGGWEQCSEADLLEMLRDHVAKGDMRDVANIAMMIHLNRAEAAPAMLKEDEPKKDDRKVYPTEFLRKLALKMADEMLWSEDIQTLRDAAEREGR